MTARKIKDGVYSVGAIDPDRRLFDELVPLPEGTTYNSYFVKGSKKTALFDTVDPAKEKVLFDNLKSLNIDKIDYLIAHHAEQDHSGSIPAVLECHPETKVVTNQKCKGFLIDLLPINEDRFIVVKDRETISLGDKTIEFIIAPWVHWPETMFSYIKEDKVLLTCDFFGSHLASSDVFVKSEDEVRMSAKRYYAEIMMPFRTSVKSHLETLKKYDIEIIGPSHGPVYQNPKFILEAYADWSSDKVKNEIVIPYVSMHGSTAKM
ncbi:MAG: FprA family A-type flavoprotein, partial [Candidatus Margulisiibacteriota bacterium]